MAKIGNVKKEQQVKWNTKEVYNILSNPDLSLEQMATLLNRSKFYVCRRRKSLGITFRATGKT